MTEKVNEVMVAPQNGVSAEALISQAIDKAVPVETMEKLLAMRRELKDEQAREAFARDFAAFQGECPVITKSKGVLNKDKKSIRYHYAPLDDIVSQVQGLLKQYGFSYTIQTINEKDPDGQRSVCTVHHVEGHSRSSEFWAPVDHEAYMSDQQKWAAASTYGKRYAFCNALGILTGDGDSDAQDAGNGNDAPPKRNGNDQDKALRKQILKDISDPHFTGEIKYKGEIHVLDTFRREINVYLSQKNIPLSELITGAERVAEMLQIACMDAEDEPVTVEPTAEGQLSEVADVFDGDIVTTETLFDDLGDSAVEIEKEGNLSG